MLIGAIAVLYFARENSDSLRIRTDADVFVDTGGGDSPGAARRRCTPENHVGETIPLAGIIVETIARCTAGRYFRTSD